MVERYQMHSNEMPIHKFIPMEKLDLIQPNQVRLLYYQNPSRFYIYLREKINSHAQTQVELQRVMQNYPLTSSPPQYQRYQPVVAQDNHAVWHRATILKDYNRNSTEITVYFVDFGQEENISITNIRPLPNEFIRQPAFAIPCRLHGIYPLHGNEYSNWNKDDPVHEIFNRHMSNNALCKVCDIKEQICYDVSIDIPKLGDLGKFLFEQDLVSRMDSRTPTPTTQQSFRRIPPGFSGIQQSTATTTTRLIQKPIVQQTPNSSTSTDISSDIPTLTPQNGNYIITHVYSATEFYGHSQGREKELDALHKHLESIYNNSNTNDQSISVHLLMEGIPCVIQQGDKYHRVIIKHRESESRVLVKLVDRGDEILVDTSELLQLEKRYFTIPAFAQPFRLYNYDESHSTANITRKLKRLILNQRVSITQHLPIINGFYPVEVKLSDNQSVNQILLSNDIIPMISLPMKSIEVQTTKPQQINEDLPAPQKLLTAQPPPTINRFEVNEQSSRFRRPLQQDKTNSPANEPQPLLSEQTRPYNRGFSTERNENSTREGRNNNENGRQRFGSFNRNNDEIGGQRLGGGSSRNDNRNNNENVGQRFGGFNRNNDETGGQRSGEGPSRNDNRNNNENVGQRFGGFNRNNDENDGQRSGGGRFNRNSGFADRGNRNGFADRHHENNGGQRTGGFSDRSARNGFNGERRNGDDNERRGRFSGPRGRGGFGNRGRGGRSGDSHENVIHINADTNETMKTFSGWPIIKPSRFEAGDNFLENEIPQDEFQFVLSHFEKLNDFFIQLYSKENELLQLTETLQNEYKDAPELNLNSIKINQACLAKSSDNCWYRAKILSIDSRKIQVRFIDFGDTLDVDIKTIRQLAKKFSLKSPYAYRCILKDIEENENMNTNDISEQCIGKKFNGKIEKKFDNEKYILQSENFQKFMIDINAIQFKPSVSLNNNNIPCLIVHIDHDKHQFYIQDDFDTMEKINTEVQNASSLSLDEIQINSMVISTFEDAPYRAIIQSDLDDNVQVYFIDYGNTNICSKESLKKCSEQLKTYPYQAKCCQLYDISLNDLDEIFQQLNEYIESDQIEYSIVKQNNEENFYFIRLYINHQCFNEKYINTNDQSSTTTATTIQEQDIPLSATGKRNNNEILSPMENSLNTTLNCKRQKSESETTEVNATKSYEGILTHIDTNKSMIYLQLLPESEENLEQIKLLINKIVQENKHNLSYEIGDYIIAQFTEDNEYYRARIESYDSVKELYTVYFLDYGNIDENITKDHLYSYSNELKNIEEQCHSYLVENFHLIHSLIEEKFNDKIEFYFIDQIQSIIHLKLNSLENFHLNQPKTFTANISGINHDYFYIHILPDTDILICEIDELLQIHVKEHQERNLWKINDLCIVYDEKLKQYFRGKILSIENELFNIQCIDYGNILINQPNENLYLLTNLYLIEQKPLARQCRLYGVNEQDQLKAIQEIIQYIPQTERITITVENEQNNQCMFVMLFRENNEIINDRYNTSETKKFLSTDSAIDTLNDQQMTSPIGIPQAESTHQFNNTTNLTVCTGNETIDFGENDPSTSNLTIKDETDT